MSKRGNGEGSIRYNESRRRWEGRITVEVVNGRAVRRMVTGRTRGQVVELLRTGGVAASQGQAPARRDLTVGRFLEQWLDDVLPGSVAATTEVQYSDVVRLYVKPHIGRKRLGTLTARDVSIMLRELEAEGRAPNTRRLARSILRCALRWAEAEGLVARNVAQIANGVRIGGDGGRTFTPEQARTFLASLAGHRLEAAFTVALALGLRRGELLGLTWDDIDLDADTPRLTVRRSLKRLPKDHGGLLLSEPKTRQSRRTVHLPLVAVTALRAHQIRQKAEHLAAVEWTELPLDADLVFRTPDGHALDPDNFRNLTYQVTAAAGTGRWSPHELRHSAASLLIAQGLELKLISELLGHSSIRITADVYGHLLEPARAETAAAMNRALGG